MGKTSREPINPEAEAAAERVLAKTFMGIHHVPYWNRRKAWGEGVTVLIHSELATFDFNYLTRLVLAAHDECVRVAVQADAGPRMIRLSIWPRKREGDISERHPSIEDAVTVWRKHHPDPAGVTAG